MAILKITAAQIVQTYAAGTTVLPPSADAAHIERLENGRLAVAWDTAVGTSSEVLNVATLDAAALHRSAVVAMDSVIPGRGLTRIDFAPLLNGNVLTSWTSDSDAPASQISANGYGRTVSTYGAAVASKYHFSTSVAGGETGSVLTRLGNGSVLAVWSDTLASADPNISTSIMARLISATGVAQATEFVLNSTASQLNYGPAAASLGDGRAVVVWAHGTAAGGETVAEGLKGRFVGPTGSKLGADFRVDMITAGGSYDAAQTEIVGLGNGGFAVVWKEIAPSGEQVHLQFFTPTGAKSGGVLVLDTAWGDRHISHVFTAELANGGLAVGWGQTGGTAADVQNVRQFTMAGAEIGSRTNLTALAGSTGLTRIDDLELMSDGRIVAFGTKGASSVATQIFDFGAKTLSGSSLNDTLYGHNGVNDRIVGATGNDKLFGLSGNDILDSGAGSDTVSGGAGYDIFVFNATLGTRDTITDYSSSNDQFQLENAIFSQLGPTTGSLPWIKFVASASGTAQDSADRILYNTTTGVLSYDRDGTGAAAAIQFALLTNKPALSSIEFTII